MSSSQTPEQLVKECYDLFKQSAKSSKTYSNHCLENSEFLENHHLAKDEKDFIFKVKIHPEDNNPIGVVHGGYIATIIDVFTTVATVGVERPFGPSVSMNLNIEFLKGIKDCEFIFVKCRNDKIGRTVVFCSCEVYDQNEVLSYKASHVKMKLKPAL